MSNTKIRTENEIRGRLERWKKVAKIYEDKNKKVDITMYQIMNELRWVLGEVKEL